jgi:DsbC/DsbD-like thiol-disulfide interchange protein
MRTNAGWHGYWLNPGDAGLPMRVEWRLPPGFAVGPLRYPVPSRLEIANLMNYVYERDYAVLVRLKVPADARGTVPIRAEAHWLACTDKICVPEQGELALDLPVAQGTPNRAQFDQWRRALPRPLATVAHFQAAPGALRVAIPIPESVALGQPYLFPITDGPVDYQARQTFRRAGDWLVAELQRKGPVGPRFDGVIALGDGRGRNGSPAPTRSAFPSKGSSRSTFPSGRRHRATGGSTSGGGRFRGRSQAEPVSKPISARYASRCRFRAT